jgi:small conductance mechanosensitive channel
MTRMDIFSPQHLSAVADQLWALTLDFGPRLFVALLIFAAALFVAQRMARAVARLMRRAGRFDPTLGSILTDFLRYAIIFLAAIIALEQIGVRAASLFAVLGAAGIAIGLALQGTLSNIAAGVMLLWLRPLRIGDYIEVNNVPGFAGSVEQIGLFASQLRAFDGLMLFVPNATLWNVAVRNYSRNTGRLISYSITIPKQITPADAAKAVLAMSDGENRMLRKPAPAVFTERIAADSAVLNFMFWAASEHIGTLQREMATKLAGALQPLSGDQTAVQIVRTVPTDADPSRLMDGEIARLWAD